MKSSKFFTLFSIMGAFVFMLILLFASVRFGYQQTSMQQIIQSFTAFDGSNAHLIIQNVRIPRALIAAAVGAALAVSGVLMQTLTKNPLASPSIFGVNAGAGLAVVIGVTVFNVSSLNAFAILAFIGAAVAITAVFGLGSLDQRGLSPLQLTLAGAALSALFASVTQGLLVLNESALESVMFWLAGSVQGRDLALLQTALPYLAAGFIIALVFSRSFNILAMGDDVANGLGVKTGPLKIWIGVIVVLLAGGAVSVAGPIGFIGIMIPHLARKWIGIDHRVLIPMSALLGANLLLAADIAARYVIMPQEIPVGVMTAIIGTPIFIYIARRVGTSQ
ncbi:FecCD family ABC transporter permease [Jeotgalibacillus haloalkalitolerans]|uniref:Iron ABC transporter permease n=1 Tax=Jeotgalibacillus haloalkalitolerans TaxID=3104292 RepID=A0ABU5KPM7_9BACL|nr:iron ABC transporter permease [Jeotgalibacillus sp. HH7-29]MDZ5713210.1 iron ABC transporter permease [Jeotgalibacillus sp. HH7-29]